MSTRVAVIEIAYCLEWGKIFALALGPLEARVARTELRDFSMSGRAQEDGPPTEQLLASLMRDLYTARLVGRVPPFGADTKAWLGKEKIRLWKAPLDGLSFAIAWYRVSGEWMGIAEEKPPGRQVRTVRRLGIAANPKANVWSLDAEMQIAAKALAARRDR